MHSRHADKIGDDGLMRRITLVLLCIVPCLSFSQAWRHPASIDSVGITYRDLTVKSKNKQIKGRLQLRITPEATWVLANDFDRLPKFFKRFVLQSKGKRYSFRRNQSLSVVKPALDSSVSKLMADTIFFADASRKTKLLQHYPHERDRFFAGAKSSLFFKHNWVPLYRLPVKLEEPVTLKISGRFTREAIYRTDSLPVGYARQLPVLDAYNCKEFDRFKELRKLDGYGIDKFKYMPYRITDRQVIRQDFDIHFEKNSADAQPESVWPVIDFLETNQYSILNAIVEGYSSLEGTEEANQRLQHKRAGILIKTLQAHNNEPILSDTVIVVHGYDLFRQAIHNTNHQWLDTLDNNALRTLLNADAELLKATEPYLIKHRKASLKLALAKKLNKEELFEQFKLDFFIWEGRLLSGNNQGTLHAQAEPRVMGMLEYLFNMMLAQQISPEEFNQVLGDAKNSDLVQILLAYHQIIQIEKKRITDSTAWHNYIKTGQFANSILNAHSSLIEKIRNSRTTGNDLKKYKAQLADIQSYLFDYVRNGWVTLNDLCAVDYPASSKFGGYKLRQLAFLNEMAQHTEVPCESFMWTKTVPPKHYTDAWLDELDPEMKRTGAIMLPDGRYIPNYGNPSFSPFLFYLKMSFLRKNKGLTQYVISSDDLYEFDLFFLAGYNVTQWIPEQNYFHDREVQLEDMHKLITMLKRVDNRICRVTLNNLYLNYHLKALHYLTQYYDPGNTQHTEIAQQSLAFISRYYSQHADAVTPRLSLYLLHQLNAFYTMPGQYDAIWYARNLLNSIRTKRPLSQYEEVLLEKYNRYYSRSVKKKPVSKK